MIRNSFNPNSGIDYVFYTDEDLSSLSVDREAIDALLKLGLPHLSYDYGFNFFPLEKPLMVNIYKSEYILLGKPFNNSKNLQDHILVLNPNDLNVLFFSEFLQKVGLVPQALSIVNTSLQSFHFFSVELTLFSKKVFKDDINNNIPFSEVKKKFKEVVRNLNEVDKVGLALHLDHRHFWRRILGDLQIAIQERYGEPLSEKELFPPTNT